MKFYGREQELQTLNEIYRTCQDDYGKITVLTGRRRIGKTMLANRHAQDKPSLYLFSSRKAEEMLCVEFLEAYERFTGVKQIGEIRSFKTVFELLLIHGKENPYVLIIDEFQDLGFLGKYIFSEIQELWDRYKFETKVHLICIGSIYSLMIDIFQNQKAPLFGRADRILYIPPFQVSTIRKILIDQGAYTHENLFYLYLITGGVPRYIELLIAMRSLTLEKILDVILQKDSFFIGEGNYLLTFEFGNEYGTYFSILELIASDRTSRPEMESIMNKSIGGYLERLEQEYDVIEKVRPMGSKPTGRIQKFRIKDPYLRFWFRFIHRNLSLVEQNQFSYIRRIIDRDLSTFAGPALEHLFIDIISDDPDYGLIGTYWERGNQNEIDIVAVNDLDKRLYLAEVKLNRDKIRIGRLKEKAKRLITRYPDFHVTYEGLSLEDIESKMQKI